MKKQSPKVKKPLTREEQEGLRNRKLQPAPKTKYKTKTYNEDDDEEDLDVDDFLDELYGDKEEEEE